MKTFQSSKSPVSEEGSKGIKFSIFLAITEERIEQRAYFQQNNDNK
jgi:hypothetical protein